MVASNMTAKRLNIIFFIGEKKINSIALSVRAVLLILTLVGGIGVWNIFSLKEIISLRNSILSAKIEHSFNQSKIFEMQSRHEQIFDRVYPTQSPEDHPDSMVPIAKTILEKE